MDRIKGEFLTLQQGSKPIDVHTGIYLEKERFASEYVPSLEARIKMYILTLRTEIREFVRNKTYNSFEAMIEACRDRENELKLQDQQTTTKRKFETMNTSNKKRKESVTTDCKSKARVEDIGTQKDGDPFGKKRKMSNEPSQEPSPKGSRKKACGRFKFPLCDECGRNHPGECLLRTNRCYICGETDHMSWECSLPHYRNYKCYKCEELGHLWTSCQEGMTTGIVYNPKPLRAVACACESEMTNSSEGRDASSP